MKKSDASVRMPELAVVIREAGERVGLYETQRDQVKVWVFNPETPLSCSAPKQIFNVWLQMGWGVGWKEGSRWNGYMYIYGEFTLLHSGN